MRFLAAVLMLFWGASAWAQSSFYASACQSEAAQKRLDRIEQQRASLDAELAPELKNLSKTLGLPYPTTKDVLSESMDNIILTFPFQLKQAKAAAIPVFKKLEESLLKRMQLPDHNKIKANLVDLIRSEPTLSAAVRGKMIENINNTRLLLPSQYIAEFVNDTEDLWPLTSRLFEDGAWNIDVGEGKHVILVYPGLLAAEVGRPLGLEFVLAHETGHSIDHDNFGEIYKNYESCLESRAGNSLSEWTEITADYWGTRAVAKLFADAQLSAQQAGARLASDLEILCGSETESALTLTEDVHPSGEFRLNQVISGEAEMALRLGSQEANTCHL